MTTIQQVLYKLVAPYYGHPYYVTGNALYNALARRVDTQARQALHVSNGVFVPGEYGSYPEEHSHPGGVPYLGTGLRPVEDYADLFLFRDPAQRWLSDSRPRDAHNTHPLQSHGGRQTYAPRTRFGRPPEAYNTRRTMTWYVHCYLHAGRGDETTVPLAEDVLDRIRVGGGRNYGFGELALKETQTVDLDALDYSGLTDGHADEGYRIEVLSPYVLTSEYPGADDQQIPWWWDVDGTNTSTTRLRRRTERLVVGGETHAVEAIDHGHVVEYAGDDPVRTAKTGVLRTGSHKKLGFGEFRLRPAGSDRVPERQGSAGRVRGGEA